MTKRFTPKTSDYTARMAEVQAKISKLKKLLAPLEAEEVSLKAFLMPYFNVGNTDVETADGTLHVCYSEQERIYLDQIKARALLARLGKKPPEFKAQIVTFKIKA